MLLFSVLGGLWYFSFFFSISCSPSLNLILLLLMYLICVVPCAVWNKDYLRWASLKFILNRYFSRSGTPQRGKVNFLKLFFYIQIQLVLNLALIDTYKFFFCCFSPLYMYICIYKRKKIKVLKKKLFKKYNQNIYWFFKTL